MYEHEAKLEVPQDFVLPDLEPILQPYGLVLRAASARSIVDVYHDTDDLRLLRWGCTLRHRRRSGWTVKIPIASKPGEIVRNEIDLGGRAGRVPVEARRLVASFGRGRDLAVVATINTERTARVVCNSAREPVAELTDDVVSTEAADGRRSNFRQIEVELTPNADPALLRPIMDALVDAGARPLTDGIKLLLALDRPQLEPEVVVPVLSGRPTADEVIRRAVARSVYQLIVQLPIARHGKDPEGVHQARVATRRLRSDLRTFKPLLDSGWAASLGNELRDLARALGHIRDADVLDQLFRATLAEQPTIESDGGEEVLALLARRRQQDLEALNAELDRPATAEVLDRLVAAAATPLTTENAAGPARQILPNLVTKPWRRLDRRVGGLARRPTPDSLHEVRILAKRARYATEAVVPAFGSKTQRFAKALGQLQDTLGDLNDASTATRWLDRNAVDLSPAGAYAAGRLAQVLAGVKTESTRWKADWKSVKRRRPNWVR